MSAISHASTKQLQQQQQQTAGMARSPSSAQGAAPPPSTSWQPLHTLHASASSPALAASASASASSYASPTSHSRRSASPSPHATGSVSASTSRGMLRSVSTVNGVTAEPLYTPAYRLAAARSTEHREQELAWQWHIYRIKQAKGKIDAKEPHCVQLRRDPRKSAAQLALHTANVFRAQEIQLANNALVSRIKGQKSTYNELFDEATVAKNAARAERALAHRKEVIEMAGTATSRTGKSSGGGGGGGGGAGGSMNQGASGLYFNSRASKNNQHRIAQDNQSLLHRLKTINVKAGPYNSAKLQSQVAEHERLVRRRLPRIMHAHPNLTSQRVLKMQPPIHYSVEAARATSPSRSVVAGVSLSSPHRAPGPLVPQQDEDWRVYAEKRGLTPQSQSRRNANGSGHSPTAQRSPLAHAGNGSATTRPKTMASRASEEKSNDGPVQQQRRPLTASSQRRAAEQLSADELLDDAAGRAGPADHAADDDDDGLDAESSASFTVHSAPSNAAAAIDGVHLFGVRARTDETAAEKVQLGRSFVHLDLDLDGGRATPCTVFCEAAGNAPPGADITALQFTCFLDDAATLPASSSSAPSNPAAPAAAASAAPLPLLILISSLDRLLPSTLQSLVSSPYRDFTSLLYALRPRFALRRSDDDHQGQLQLSLQLEPDFVPINNRTQQMQTTQQPPQQEVEEIGEAAAEAATEAAQDDAAAPAAASSSAADPASADPVEYDDEHAAAPSAFD